MEVKKSNNKKKLLSNEQEIILYLLKDNFDNEIYSLILC